MTDHPAVVARRLVQELKGKRDPRSLVAAAKKIEDEGQAAWALIRISSDPRLTFPEAAQALQDALQRIEGLDRLSRRAELWADLLRRLPTWRAGARHKHAAPTRAMTMDRVIQDIEAMPDGQWVLDVITAGAGHVDAKGRARLLRRAALNQGFEVAGCRAVLRAAPMGEEKSLRAEIELLPAPLQAHLLGRVHTRDAIAAAWDIQDRTQRLEELRVLVWRADDQATLEAIVASAAKRDGADRARVLTTAAARADKLGLCVAWFDEAADVVAKIEDPRVRAKEAAKLATALERAGTLVPDALRDAAKTTDGTKASSHSGHVEKSATPRTAPAANRHTLALVNGYDGGLGPNHIRAIARAAPLCDAFDLDLLLVDFPVKDASSLAVIVASETRIGEERHVAALADAGRLHLRAWSDEAPWPGDLVASTPKPAAHKRRSLEGATCLLMGLGHHGLPKAILDAVPSHYEITGKEVSLETATAMGILAERLRATAL